MMIDKHCFQLYIMLGKVHLSPAIVSCIRTGKSVFIHNQQSHETFRTIDINHLSLRLDHIFHLVCADGESTIQEENGSHHWVR